MSTGPVVSSMIMCILMGACAILTEIQEFIPESLSDRSYLAIMIAWGVFLVSAVGVAASGIF